MFHLSIRRFFLGCLLACVLAGASAVAQSISAVQLEASNDRGIVIHYYLVAESEESRYDVSLEFSTDGGSSFFTPVALSGDVGTVWGTGSKSITWSALTERDSIQSDACVVRLCATEIASVGEVLTSFFAGSAATRRFVNGVTLLGGGGQCVFRSNTYKTSRQAGWIVDEYGYELGARITYLPFVFDASYFNQRYRLTELSSADINVRQSGVNISASFALLPYIKYFIPYIGGGYQFSRLELESNSISTETASASTSQPFYMVGINIALASYLDLGGDYRRSFALDKNGVEAARQWDQWRVTAGLHFANPD